MSKKESKIPKEDILDLIGVVEDEIEKDPSIKVDKIKGILKLDRKKHINKLGQYYLKYINSNREELRNLLVKLKDELTKKIDGYITIYLNYGNNGDKLQKGEIIEEEVFALDETVQNLEAEDDIEIDKVNDIKDNLTQYNIKELLALSEIFKYKVDIINEDIDLLIMLNIVDKDDNIEEYLENTYERPENLYNLLEKVGYEYGKYEDYLKGYYYNNKNNQSLINDFYDHLSDQRKNLVNKIKNAYYTYLDNTGFNALDEDATYKFCLFENNNFKKYTFTNLLKTWHHYKNLDYSSKKKKEEEELEQEGGADSDDEIEKDVDEIVDTEDIEVEIEKEEEEDEKKAKKAAKKAKKKLEKAKKKEKKVEKKQEKKNKKKWKESISINMMNYVKKRKDFMKDILKIPNLTEDFKKYLEELNQMDIDLADMSVDHKLFYEFMDYYFKKHKSGTRYYQKVLELYMSYHSYVSNKDIKSRGLLVNHGLGTGKTRTALNVIKGCFYNFNKGWEEMDKKHLKKIFIFIPASLRYDPWTQHLISKETRPFETIHTEYDLPLHNIYIVHYNGVNNINKFLNTVTDDILNNALVIIDETHNITNSLPKNDEDEYGEMGKLYLKLLNNKSNYLKIICLTGTPILNYTMEYLYIMKLVKGKKNFIDKLKLTYPEKFNKDKDENIQILKFFLEFNNIFEKSLFFNEESIELRNKVNMLTFEDRETIIPYIKDHQYELTTTIEEFKKWKYNLIYQINKINSKDLIYIEKIKSLFSGLLSYYKGFDQSRINRQYLFIPLTNLQSNIIEKIKMEGEVMFQDLRSQIRSMKRAEEIKMTKSLSKSFQGVVSGLALKEGQDNDKKIRKSTLFREAENICYRRSTSGKFPLIKGSFEELVSNKIENEEDDHKFTYSNMLNYSNKFSTLMVNIFKHEGCHLVYCKYEDIYGIKSIAKMLKDVLGYEEYRSSQLIYNQEPKRRFAIYNPSKEPMLVSDFNKEYAMIDGELVKGPNKLGEYIKVLLITDKAKEGVNFKSIQYEHIINPWWNVNIINQIIGRGIRINSHDYLKNANLWNDEVNKVTVFYYTSTNKFFNTEDIKIGIISKNKYKANINFYNTINSTSIDCMINSSDNNNMCIPYDEDKIERLVKEDFTEVSLSNKISEFRNNLTKNYKSIINTYSDNNSNKFQHIGLIQDTPINGTNMNKNIASKNGLHYRLRNYSIEDNPIVIISCDHDKLAFHIEQKLIEFEYKKEKISISGSNIDYLIYEVKKARNLDFPAVEYTNFIEKEGTKGTMSFKTHNIDIELFKRCSKRVINFNIFLICGIDILISKNMHGNTKEKILNAINENRSKKFLYKDMIYLINNRISYYRTIPKSQTKNYTNTLELFDNIKDVDNTYFVILLNNFEEDLFFIDKRLKEHKNVKKRIQEIISNQGYLSDKKVVSILDTIKKLENFTLVVPNREDMNNVKIDKSFEKTVYENKYLFISK